MKIKSFLYLYLLLLLGLASSCSDDPNSVGNGLIPDDDKLNSIKVDSQTGDFEQSFTSFQQDSVYFGSSSRILLGSYDNITSEVLIRFLFSLPDSVQNSIESNETVLTTAWVEMIPNYWIGDSNAYTFSAQRISTRWNSIGLDDDSLAIVKNNLGPDMIDSLVYASADTSLKFYLNNNDVEDWIKNSYDENYSENNGMLLSPTSQNGIAGFQALTNFPSDEYPALIYLLEKFGDVDTFYAVPSLDIHVISGTRKEDPPNGIILQSALSVRGKLKFDLSTVPKDLLVNSAILDLYFDENESERGTITKDTIAVSLYKNSSADSISTEFGRYPLTRDSDKYTGEIRQFVQRWLDGEKNEGVEVKLSDEARTATKITFYGSDYPNTSLRPRLTIYYTIK